MNFSTPQSFTLAVCRRPFADKKILDRIFASDKSTEGMATFTVEENPKNRRMAKVTIHPEPERVFDLETVMKYIQAVTSQRFGTTLVSHLGAA